MHEDIFKEEYFVIDLSETLLYNILNIFVLLVQCKDGVSWLSGLHDCMHLLILFINEFLNHLKINIELNWK